MKKWVVISCTPNSLYDFFLPIAVRLWRNRIGYEPVVILVGEKEEWSRGHARVVCDEIQNRERIEFFPMIPGLPDSSVSMGVRQHVAALEFPGDDLMLIGDVDLFPVNREFYHRYDPSMGPVGVYYSELYKDEYWPAYGISMLVKNWREVMGLTVGDLRGSVERTFEAGGVRELVAAHRVNHLDTRFWTFDERWTSLRIRSSRFAPEVVKFLSFENGRYPHRARLPSRPDVLNYIDFHCSRPGWNGENWPDLRHALGQVLPEDVGWLTKYVSAYRASL